MQFLKRKSNFRVAVVAGCLICIFISLNSRAERGIESKVHPKDLITLRKIAENAGISLESFTIISPDSYTLKRDKLGNILISTKRLKEFRPLISLGPKDYTILIDSDGFIVGIQIRESKFSKTELLENLDRLLFVEMWANNIKELSISNHRNIEHLVLQGNGIRDIKCLANLPNLKVLDLDRNHLKQFHNVKNLPKLQKLVLSENPLSKIENMLFPSLRDLDLSISQREGLITKIEGLSELTHLKKLNLNFQPIKRMENLKGLTELEDLNLVGTKIEKIENIDGLKNLKTLCVDKNVIRKIEGLNKLANLESLYATECNIQKIEGLDKLAKLIYLNLSDNEGIKKIEGLDNQKRLEKLLLNGTSISTIENLDNLTSLEELEMGNTKISKIEGLENNLNLFKLRVSDTNISKLENYQHLKKLRYFSYRRTKVHMYRGNPEIKEVEKFLWENSQRERKKN